MAANPQIERQSILSTMLSTVMVPKYPNLFDALKVRLPDQRKNFEVTEVELEKWREGLQLSINRALEKLAMTQPTDVNVLALSVQGNEHATALAGILTRLGTAESGWPAGDAALLSQLSGNISIPGVFNIALDPSKPAQEWFAEAAQVFGAVVLLPPWPITLTGPIDVKNIAAVLGWGQSLSKITHIGAGPLFTGIYNYANHLIYPHYAGFSVAHFGAEIATFLELGGQQHIQIERLKIEGYPGGKYLRFVNADPVAVPGFGFGTWTENIRISNVFSYGHPAVGLECVNESLNGQQNSFINFWCDMHFSLDGATSIGMLFHRAHITAGVFSSKFNLHAPGTCMKVENNSLLRNSEYRMNIEEPGTRLDLDATSVLHGYGTFIRTDVNALDNILGQVISPAYEPILSDGYQIPP